MKRLACLLLVSTVLLAACGNDEPTDTTPTVTPADPTTTEIWEGTLAVGATRFYSFSVVQYGTVNLTLTSLSDASGEVTTPVQVSIGFPAGTGCTATSSATTAAGTDFQVSNIYDPGVWCVRIQDVGNLVGPATFRLAIAHP
ncbi:MAG: hypothetical protein AB7I13_02145 [Vicinamibacterales bacterium]